MGSRRLNLCVAAGLAFAAVLVAFWVPQRNFTTESISNQRYNSDDTNIKSNEAGRVSPQNPTQVPSAANQNRRVAQGDTSSGEIPPVEDPLLIYTDQHPDYVRLFGQAQDLLAAACMRKFGFSYTNLFDLVATEKADHDATARLYGPTDWEVAQKYGSQPAPSSVRNDRNNPVQSAEYELALTGSPPGTDPTLTQMRTSPGRLGQIEIPASGCLGEARNVLTGDPAMQLPPDANALRLRTFFEALNSKRSSIVIKEWSKCMRAKKYGRTSPLDGRQISEEEVEDDTASQAAIDEALADIACKRSTDLVRRLNKIHVDSAREAIEDNAVMLGSARSRVEKTKATAKTVLGIL